MEKLKRISAMSAKEIGHRLREAFRRRTDAWRVRFGVSMDQDPELDELIRRHGSSLKGYFTHGPARRFYASTQDQDGAFEFVLQRFPEWLDCAVQQARDLAEHRVSLFAHRDIFLGDTIDWHRDPISGFQWPRRYFADYDLVHHPPADAKIIHELNRHPHLPRLAKAFFLTGDETYAREALAQIESWIEQNPKQQGVNWHSSLEIGIRAISWMWTIFLLLHSRSLDEETLRSVCRSLFAQLDHIHRYPSTYTSPNTHLIGEAAALFIGGVLFPELPRAQAWREFGMQALTSEMERQVLEDGVYGELSSYYHCYATDFYVHVLVLARRNQIRFPQPVWDRLSRMIDFVMNITRPDGSMPFLGDDDGGRVLGIAAENYASYRDGLSTGAVLFGRPDFKSQSGGFREDTFWLFGEDAWPIFDSLPARNSSELRHAFDHAGYYIQRSGWGAEDTHVIFDCGGMGLGAGGHAHADALSFTVFSGGREFLIDPGTSAYNCAPEWRSYFRSTAAHNSVVVDHAGQAQPSSTFRWKQKTQAVAKSRIALPEIDYVEGVVEFPVTHRRRLVHVRPNYWIILDEVRGKGPHHCEFLYHFAPDAQITLLSDEERGEIDCRVCIDDAGLQLSMYASDAVQAEAICGVTDPIQGWSSRLYGERHASPVVRASVQGISPVSMMSFLMPGNVAMHSRRFRSNPKHAIAAAMEYEDTNDVAVMALEDGDLRFMDYLMRGEFFLFRHESGCLRRLVAVNAYSLSYAGETIFESNEMIPYVQVYFWENGLVVERAGKVYVRDLRNRQFQRK
jgi:hypothetical protein